MKKPHPASLQNGAIKRGNDQADNTVQLLRCVAADERTPIRIHGPRRIRDVLVTHPDGAVFVRRCRRVITPASDAAAGAELRVTSEPIVRECAGAGNPDCARAVHVNRRVPSAGEEVRSDYAECHQAFALTVDPYRGKHYVLLIGAIDRDITLVDYRG